MAQVGAAGAVRWAWEGLARVFFGRAGLDAQGMDVVLHELAEGLVDEPMTAQRGQAGELAGDDVDPEVTLAFACPGVADVQVALVGNFEFLGLQRVLEPRADQPDAPVCVSRALVHGSTCLKGLTCTLA